MLPLGTLLEPLTSPFRIYHKRRSHKTRLGTDHNSHLTWEHRELPGAGAGQYAWETYGLPPYAVFGTGNINVQAPLRETFPASYVFQSVGIVGAPPVSISQGQFTTQPLMDPDFAANIGVVTPGAITGGPNTIYAPSPVLSP